MNAISMDEFSPARRVRIGACIVDLALHHVWRGEQCVRVAPKATAVLNVLLGSPERMASKDLLLDRVWAGESRTEDVITNAIAQLRRAFGDSSRFSRYLLTIPRVGYAIVAPVQKVCGTDVPSVPTFEGSVSPALADCPYKTLCPHVAHGARDALASLEPLQRTLSERDRAGGA
jgi:DNA-binding winged helix-turn-helix (wHTH) protein